MKEKWERGERETDRKRKKGEGQIKIYSEKGRA